jgi:hypothetical protein
LAFVLGGVDGDPAAKDDGDKDSRKDGDHNA